MSPAAPEATNRASTTPRRDGVARLAGRDGEVATATGRTPRRSMRTPRRLPDDGPARQATVHIPRNRSGPGGVPTIRTDREGGHAASPGGGGGGAGRDGGRGRVRQGRGRRQRGQCRPGGAGRRRGGRAGPGGPGRSTLGGREGGRLDPGGRRGPAGRPRQPGRPNGHRGPGGRRGRPQQ